MFYHGSDSWFGEFRKSREAYPDGGLWLTSDPLIAACYGRFVYGCSLRTGRLLLVPGESQIDDAIGNFENGGTDGVIIPGCREAGPEAEITFWADRIFLFRPEAAIIEDIFTCEESLDFFRVQIHLVAEDGKARQGGKHSNRELADFSLKKEDEVCGWKNRIRDFLFQRAPMLSFDASLSVRAAVRDLLLQARKRQGEVPGARPEGIVLQHLVGAKLDLVLGEGVVMHHPAGGSDQGEGKNRVSDFQIGDFAIHVTTHPGEALIDKCRENLSAGLWPVIVTTLKMTAVADGLAETRQIADRIDVLDIEQFLAANLHERSLFRAENRASKIRELIARYNALLETHETDPSLHIEIPGK